MVRDVLMVIYAAAWLFVVILTAWRTGGVPPELWAVLGVGEGGLLAVFRAEPYIGRRRAPRGTPPSGIEDDS